MQDESRKILVTVGFCPPKKEKGYHSGFPGFTFNTEPLWGSTIMEESPFIKSFDDSES